MSCVVGNPPGVVQVLRAPAGRIHCRQADRADHGDLAIGRSKASLLLPLRAHGVLRARVATPARHLLVALAKQSLSRQSSVIVDALEAALRAEVLGPGLHARGVEGTLRDAAVMGDFVDLETDLRCEGFPAAGVHCQILPLALHESLMELLRPGRAEIPCHLLELLLRAAVDDAAPRWPVISRQHGIGVIGGARLVGMDAGLLRSREVEALR
mmetsp:Transcript_8871/g.18928  ORF Transcript_8871/g.18928 Transcript_8871/m.18928 type:complete len:212 (-) Transcript_8871:2404-3039(-)